MKKRILRDPETGEIVGATRAPFLKAKLESQFMEEKISEDTFSQDDEEIMPSMKSPISVKSWVYLLPLY